MNFTQLQQAIDDLEADGQSLSPEFVAELIVDLQAFVDRYRQRIDEVEQAFLSLQCEVLEKRKRCIQEAFK